MLQSTIANVNRNKKVRPYKAEQFLPKWEPAEPAGPMTGEDMLRAVKRYNRNMGGEQRG
jgi:hypothetical protein